MKIAFWTPTLMKNAGASSSMISIASAAAMEIADESNKTVGIIQTKFASHSIDYALLGKGVLGDSFFGTGIDALLTAAKSRCVTEDDVKNSSISVLDDHLLLYKATIQKIQESYEADMSYFLDVYDALGDYLENVFVDIGNGIGGVNLDVLKASDVIVVNLSQNAYLIEQAMKEIKMLNLTNVYYCIGNYDSGSATTIKNLQKKYSPMKRHTLVVPRNVDFMDAFGNGTVREFFLKNYKSTEKSSAIYPYFSQLKNNLKVLKLEVRDDE